jgi:tRNA threonylcarbamoyladenosine biosynthesis protein TsaB
MTPPERLLAFDVAGAACSAAIWEHGRIRASARESMSRGHSERLLPMIQSVLAAAGLEIADLDAIAVTRGPGGFTGVRIGLAAARGLALAGGLPALGLTGFQASAAALTVEAAAGRRIVVALESKRAEFYLQQFLDPVTAASAPTMIGTEALAQWLPEGPLVVVGDAAARLVEALGSARARAGAPIEIAPCAGSVDVAVLAELAVRLAQSDPDSLTLEPLYLRPPDVSRPRAN